MYITGKKPWLRFPFDVKKSALDGPGHPGAFGTPQRGGGVTVGEARARKLELEPPRTFSSRPPLPRPKGA